MSLKRVEPLTKKPVFKAEDVVDLITAAERSAKGRCDGVSNAEARAVADLYLRSRSHQGTPKAPTPVLEGEAVNKLNAFFIAHNLPYGNNRGPMKDRVLRMLAGQTMGEPMARAPRTGSLQPLRLSGSDQERRDAYVDIVKKQFVVRVSDGSAAQFYGPFALE